MPVSFNVFSKLLFVCIFGFLAQCMSNLKRKIVPTNIKDSHEVKMHDIFKL